MKIDECLVLYESEINKTVCNKKKQKTRKKNMKKKHYIRHSTNMRLDTHAHLKTDRETCICNFKNRKDKTNRMLVKHICDQKTKQKKPKQMYDRRNKTKQKKMKQHCCNMG